MALRQYVYTYILVFMVTVCYYLQLCFVE